jgi:hypothetical protein
MSDTPCATCQGIIDDDCPECLGRGVIPERRVHRDDHRVYDGYQIDRPGEDWREIANHPGYSASQFGRVRNDETGYILKTQIGVDGRPYCVIHRDGMANSISVHRAVAQAHLRGFDPKKQVEFIDGDHANCSVENLIMGLKPVRGKGRK